VPRHRERSRLVLPANAVASRDEIRRHRRCLVSNREMRLETPLRAPRLQLRTLGVADATKRYLEWMRDPEINRYLESRFAEHSIESLARFIETRNEGSTELLLGICLVDGCHIGNIKLGPVEWHHRNAAVGLLIGEKDCWGKGYASEAIVTVATYAFADLALEKLYAGCYASNVGSARAFVKAGWTQEGRLGDHWLAGGRRDDGLQFGITRTEWAAGPG